MPPTEAILPARRFTTRGGRTLDFTALGLGTAPLGNMHHALDESEAQAAIDAAWDGGVRYFDTAPLYGHGLAELRLGHALRERPRREFLLSSKVGRLLEPCKPDETESGIYKATPPLRVRFDYSYDGVMRSYEESRKRLGLDRIDILYVHDVDARTHGSREHSERRIRELLDMGGWRALSELRSSGDVAAIGAGVNEWEPCARLLELADPDLFLLAGRYTLLEHAPLDTLFPKCVAHRVGIVIGGPFNSGVLAGKAYYDYGSVPRQIAVKVSALSNICRAWNTSLAEAALQFPLAHPSVVSVIPGAQNAPEMLDNLAALKKTINVGLWDDLKQTHLVPCHAPTPEAVPC